MKKPICQEHRLSRSRAAGMAAATRGRARTFEDRKYACDDSDEEIAEGVAERAAQRLKDAQQLQRDYADLD